MRDVKCVNIALLYPQIFVLERWPSSHRHTHLSGGFFVVLTHKFDLVKTLFAVCEEVN